MRAGRSAAVGVVAKGVDVHAALSVGVLARDVPGDGGGSRLGILHEGNGPRDLGVTTDDGNCRRVPRLANARDRLRTLRTLRAPMVVLIKIARPIQRTREGKKQNNGAWTTPPHPRTPPPGRRGRYAGFCHAERLREMKIAYRL